MWSVRFTPESGHAQHRHRRPLSAISGTLMDAMPSANNPDGRTPTFAYPLDRLGDLSGRLPAHAPPRFNDPPILARKARNRMTRAALATWSASSTERQRRQNFRLRMPRGRTVSVFSKVATPDSPPL